MFVRNFFQRQANLFHGKVLQLPTNIDSRKQSDDTELVTSFKSGS